MSTAIKLYNVEYFRGQTANNYSPTTSDYYMLLINNYRNLAHYK